VKTEGKKGNCEWHNFELYWFLHCVCIWVNTVYSEGFEVTNVVCIRWYVKKTRCEKTMILAKVFLYPPLLFKESYKQ